MERLEVKYSAIEVVQGDITKEKTDAIVNAANKELTPGGGVSGAIHEAAGPELYEETRKLGGCETGEAKITFGYNLSARYVIHTVGPVYSGSPEDPQLLRFCYEQSLQLASTHYVQTISFPAISAGIFGYPLDEAAYISLTTVRDYLLKHHEILTVRFVLFGQDVYDAYKATLNNLEQP